METEGTDLNHALIRAARQHRHVAGLLLGELGLHPGQEAVLQLLWKRDGRSQAELATTLGIEPPTVHRSLVSLERAGFLRRVPSPTDRRATSVRLTARGRSCEPEVVAAWEELTRWTTAGLTAVEQQTLRDLLLRVAADLAMSTDAAAGLQQAGRRTDRR